MGYNCFYRAINFRVADQEAVAVYGIYQCGVFYKVAIPSASRVGCLSVDQLILRVGVVQIRGLGKKDQAGSSLRVGCFFQDPNDVRSVGKGH